MRKRRTDFSEAEAPFECLMGEQWDEVRAEVANMGRHELERELEGRGHEVEGNDLEILWLRYTLAYEKMNVFYLERGREVPGRMVERMRKLATYEGFMPPEPRPEFRDIFYAQRAGEREVRRHEEALEGSRRRAVAREEEERDVQ